MREIFASNLHTGLAPGRTAARKILARLARQVRQASNSHCASCLRPHSAQSLLDSVDGWQCVGLWTHFDVEGS
jgi:hypothetical protein